jgi:pSer/pThr/pTyr-binding forkhead associated (FHA) protein
MYANHQAKQPLEPANRLGGLAMPNKAASQDQELAQGRTLAKSRSSGEGRAEKLRDGGEMDDNRVPYLNIHGTEGRVIFPLIDADYWTIGRDHTNDIVLSEKWVSRNHATLQLVGALPDHRRSRPREGWQRPPIAEGVFYLVDLSSRNGSCVNGQRATSPVPLQNGDRIAIGQTEIEFYTPYKLARTASPLNLPTAPVARTNLTPSEERVFWEVVQGFTNKEIGKRLQISPRTVQTHLSSIMTKLNLENRAQIVRFAFERERPGMPEVM